MRKPVLLLLSSLAMVTSVLMAHYLTDLKQDPVVDCENTIAAPIEGGRTSNEEIAAVIARAQRGDAQSQLALGATYLKGVGLAQSDALATKWFCKAAKQGNAQAEFMLGTSYAEGRGVQCNDVEAVSWYRRSAEQGSAEGQFGLAMQYHFGRGVPQDDVEAFFWLVLSSSGNKQAVGLRDLIQRRLSGAQVEQVRLRVARWQLQHPPKAG